MLVRDEDQPVPKSNTDDSIKHDLHESTTVIVSPNHPTNEEEFNAYINNPSNDGLPVMESATVLAEGTALPSTRPGTESKITSVILKNNSGPTIEGATIKNKSPLDNFFPQANAATVDDKLREEFAGQDTREAVARSGSTYVVGDETKTYNDRVYFREKMTGGWMDNQYNFVSDQTVLDALNGTSDESPRGSRVRQDVSVESAPVDNVQTILEGSSTSRDMDREIRKQEKAEKGQVEAVNYDSGLLTVIDDKGQRQELVGPDTVYEYVSENFSPSQGHKGKTPGNDLLPMKTPTGRNVQSGYYETKKGKAVLQNPFGGYSKEQLAGMYGSDVAEYLAANGFSAGGNVTGSKGTLKNKVGFTGQDKTAAGGIIATRDIPGLMEAVQDIKKKEQANRGVGVGELKQPEKKSLADRAVEVYTNIFPSTVLTEVFYPDKYKSNYPEGTAMGTPPRGAVVNPNPFERVFKPFVMPNDSSMGDNKKLEEWTRASKETNMIIAFSGLGAGDTAGLAPGVDIVKTIGGIETSAGTIGSLVGKAPGVKTTSKLFNKASRVIDAVDYTVSKPYEDFKAGIKTVQNKHQAEALRRDAFLEEVATANKKTGMKDLDDAVLQAIEENPDLGYGPRVKKYPQILEGKNLDDIPVTVKPISSDEGRTYIIDSFDDTVGVPKFRGLFKDESGSLILDQRPRIVKTTGTRSELSLTNDENYSVFGALDDYEFSPFASRTTKISLTPEIATLTSLTGANILSGRKTGVSDILGTDNANKTDAMNITDVITGQKQQQKQSQVLGVFQTTRQDTVQDQVTDQITNTIQGVTAKTITSNILRTSPPPENPRPKPIRPIIIAGITNDDRDIERTLNGNYKSKVRKNPIASAEDMMSVLGFGGRP